MDRPQPTSGAPRLAQQMCKPCAEGGQPLKGQELQELLAQVEGWTPQDDKLITKTYKFHDFAGALDFVDEVGELAEQQGHHPDIHLSWGKVKIDLSTHKINGLSENDFILAARIDRIAAGSAIG